MKEGDPECSSTTLSVALCTCNSALYLQEQLDSLAGQTRQPDELVVYDDGSTDDTRTILKAFARNAPFPVVINWNDRNMGPTANFQQAIDLCQGELIALCDHDDVWHPAKLARCEAGFFERPEPGLVYCDGNMVDGALVSMGYRLSKALGYTRREWREVRRDQLFDLLLRRPRIAGVTLLFSGRFKEFISPIPSEWFHDEWISTLVSALAPVRYIDEPLLEYRRHGGNVFGTLVSGAVDEKRTFVQCLTGHYTRIYVAIYLKEVIKADQLIDRLLFACPDSTVIGSVRRKRAFLALRACLPRLTRRRRLPAVMREACLGRYSRYGEGWGSIVTDLLRARVHWESDLVDGL